jgi:hypothetical protein
MITESVDDTGRFDPQSPRQAEDWLGLGANL